MRILLFSVGFAQFISNCKHHRVGELLDGPRYSPRSLRISSIFKSAYKTHRGTAAPF